MKPKITANLLYKFLLQRSGISEQELYLDFIQHYQLTAVRETVELPEHKAQLLKTDDYEITLSRYKKVTQIKHKPSAKKPVAYKPKQSAKPQKPRTTHSKPKPISHESGIVQQIQSEGTVRQPRVYIKRKKTMEPH